MEVGNEELITPRDLRRRLTPALQQIADGEIKKLVLMQGGTFRYVVLPVGEYERLEALDRDDG